MSMKKISKELVKSREPPQHLIWLYDELINSEIYPYIKRVFLAENYLSLTLLIKCNRFRCTLIHILRTSRYCFRICLNNKMYTRKNYKSALFTIENLIKKELKL